jgi:hypothetical protein
MTRSNNGILRASHLGLYLLILVVGLSACAVSPRHRDRIASRGTPITFTGFTPFPNEVIGIIAGCRGTPVGVGLASTGSQVALTDSGGTAWYQYSATVSVHPSLWCQTNEPVNSPQRFFTRVGTRGTTSGPLGVFASRQHAFETGSVALEDCATNTMTGGDIRNLCALDVPDDLAIIFAAQ